MSSPSRFLRVIIALLVAASTWTAARAHAGCGCDKPPPPFAPIRPSFASPGGDVSLFGPGLDIGKRYAVTFGSNPGVTIEATATLRRDFADGIARAQLVVPAPALPSGPTGVTVRLGETAVLTIPPADFTMLPPPLVLLEGNVKVLVDSYSAAVGADGTVYFPLDIGAIAEATTFRGRALGYRLTFGESDVTIYNTQGIVMDLLASTDPAIFAIHDDPDVPTDADDGPTLSASRSFELGYDRHEFASYLAAHATDPGLALNPGDPSWHVNGTRHIEHFRLVVAIRGTLDDLNVAVPAGRTPAFTFRVKTRPAGDGNGHDANALVRRLDATNGGGPRGPLAFTCSSLPAAPCSGTAAPHGAKLSVIASAGGNRDRLTWNWTGGAGRSPRELGDLVGRHALAFCLYDESEPTPRLVAEAGIPAAAVCRTRGAARSCWKAMGRPPGDKGFRYVDRDRRPGGIAKLAVVRRGKKHLELGLGTGSDQIVIPPLPLGSTLRAQLQSSNGQCLDATYSPSGIERNGAARFEARSD